MSGIDYNRGGLIDDFRGLVDYLSNIPSENMRSEELADLRERLQAAKARLLTIEAPDCSEDERFYFHEHVPMTAGKLKRLLRTVDDDARIVFGIWGKGMFQDEFMIECSEVLEAFATPHTIRLEGPGCILEDKEYDGDIEYCFRTDAKGNLSLTRWEPVPCESSSPPKNQPFKEVDGCRMPQPDATPTL